MLLRNIIVSSNKISLVSVWLDAEVSTPGNYVTKESSNVLKCSQFRNVNVLNTNTLKLD